MYKLILHHVYRSASFFVDISGHGNHAQGEHTSWSSDGAAQGSGAVVFNGNNSRAVVLQNPLWQDLYALRVEALVRFDPVQGTPGQPVRVRRHMIVEGPLSFSIFIAQDRTVVGMVMGLLKDPKADDDQDHSSPSDTLTATLTGGGSADPFDTLVADVPNTLPVPPGYKLDWIPVASTAEFAPDGKTRMIEPGQWTRVVFVHNGTSLWLYLDGVLAGARHDIESPVLPVQGTGVHIGCAPGSNPFTLRGRLDELRIWKYDPYLRAKKFFCRPMSLEAQACWRLLLGKIEALAADPATRRQILAVLDCVSDAETALARAVFRHGQPAVVQAQRFGRLYDELWCRGAIDGQAMRNLSREFIGWLDNMDGDALPKYYAHILECVQKLKGLDFGSELCELTECDPAFARFLEGINRNLRDDLLGCETGKKRPPKPEDPERCDEKPDYSK